MNGWILRILLPFTVLFFDRWCDSVAQYGAKSVVWIVHERMMEGEAMRGVRPVAWWMAILVCLASCLAVTAADGNGLLVLEHAGVTVGIKLDAGASVLLLQRGDSGNMLRSDPALWSKVPPEPAMDLPYEAYNGHITWIGPQTMFWARQQLHPGRTVADPTWPPDPFILYGRFTVLERSPQHVLLQGPQSPVSGVQLRKEFRILDDGGVLARVEATNIRNEPVQFNLWSNTRVDGSWLCLTPAQNRMLRIENKIWEPYTVRGLAWELDETCFHFNVMPASDLTGQVTERSAKAFITPSRGLIAAFGPKAVLVKRFAAVAMKQLAAGQAPVEVYQCVSRDPARHISELEFYSPYLTYQPGQTAVIEERWDVLPAPAATDAAGRARWLLDTAAGLAVYPPKP